MSTIPRINAVGKTDIGLKRNQNEDALAVDDEKGYFLVADGMGGAAAGEIASRIFADTAREILENRPIHSEDEAIDIIQEAFSISNGKILSHIEKNPAHAGMGCTAELLTLTPQGFVLGHIGDSRTYRLRDGVLKQLTKDHSLVQEQIDRGLITPQEAKNHTNRNVILRAVGTGSQLALDIIRGKVYTDDQFLLCSDGLTDLVDDEAIFDTLNSEDSLAEKVTQLVTLAKEAGGNDNITVVLSQILQAA